MRPRAIQWMPWKYDKAITYRKMGGTATTVGSTGVIVFAAIYLARAYLPVELWPVVLDEPVALALTALISAVVRGGFNYLKHGKAV